MQPALTYVKLAKIQCAAGSLALGNLRLLQFPRMWSSFIICLSFGSFADRTWLSVLASVLMGRWRNVSGVRGLAGLSSPLQSGNVFEDLILRMDVPPVPLRFCMGFRGCCSMAGQLFM